jgi:hypothetical protein
MNVPLRRAVGAVLAPWVPPIGFTPDDSLFVKKLEIIQYFNEIEKGGTQYCDRVLFE